MAYLKQRQFTATPYRCWLHVVLPITEGQAPGAPKEMASGQLANTPTTLDPDTNIYSWTATWHLADRFQLSPYDAAYLELAQRRKLPLATLDQQLRAAGKALGLGLLGDET